MRSFRFYFVAGALAWPVLSPPSHGWAATADATVGVSVSVAPQLLVEGTGAAGPDAGATVPAASPAVGGGAGTSAAPATEGVPFSIRVCSNASWQWSVRAEGAAGLPAPLQCVYAYRGIQTFGGAPGGPGQVEIRPVAEVISGPPLPRGEVVLEGRVIIPSGVTPDAPWEVTLVWTIAQESVNAGQPLIRTLTTHLHGGTAAAAPSGP